MVREMVQKSHGRWEVIASLGEGGQAHTFTVRDTTGAIASTCVLKRLKNVDRVIRFKREIEAIERLAHPAIVKLIDSELNSQKPYLVKIGRASCRERV